VVLYGVSFPLIKLMYYVDDDDDDDHDHDHNGAPKGSSRLGDLL
jgi:hypothetical protein